MMAAYDECPPANKRLQLLSSALRCWPCLVHFQGGWSSASHASESHDYSATGHPHLDFWLRSTTTSTILRLRFDCSGVVETSTFCEIVLYSASSISSLYLFGSKQKQDDGCNMLGVQHELACCYVDTPEKYKNICVCQFTKASHTQQVRHGVLWIPAHRSPLLWEDQ